MNACPTTSHNLRPVHGCTVQVPLCISPCSSHQEWLASHLEASLGKPSPATIQTQISCTNCRNRCTYNGSRTTTRRLREILLGATGVKPTHWTNRTTHVLTGTTWSPPHKSEITGENQNIVSWTSGSSQKPFTSSQEPLECDSFNRKLFINFMSC